MAFAQERWYSPDWMANKKNAAAVALGRKGGKKKVAKGFALMEPKRRATLAREAAQKRWQDSEKGSD
jgi:hypothetical protein